MGNSSVQQKRKQMRQCLTSPHILLERHSIVNTMNYSKESSRLFCILLFRRATLKKCNLLVFNLGFLVQILLFNTLRVEEICIHYLFIKYLVADIYRFFVVVILMDVHKYMSGRKKIP